MKFVFLLDIMILDINNGVLMIKKLNCHEIFQENKFYHVNFKNNCNPICTISDNYYER